jgi:transposase
MATPSRSRRDVAALEARRFQAAGLFARGASQSAVARALGVTPVTAHHWYHAWHANGRAGLKAAGRLGRTPKLGPKQLATIERALRAGPRVYGFSTDLWTLPRAAIAIERLTRVRHHPGHVWRILRGLNWSLQRPARRARERDEAAIAQWKTRRWAQLKKTPAASGPGSSSKTKAASRSSPSSAARGPRAARRRS